MLQHICRPLEKFLREKPVTFVTHLSHNPLPLHTHLEIVSKLEAGESTNRRELLTALVEHMELNSGKYDLKTLKMANLTGIQNGLSSLSDGEIGIIECVPKVESWLTSETSSRSLKNSLR
jgi:hypothetical protein